MTKTSFSLACSMKMKISLFMLKTAGESWSRGRVCFESIHDKSNKFNIWFNIYIASPTKGIFSDTPQPSRNSNQAPYLSTTFHPSPAENSNPFCGCDETWCNYTM